MANKQTYLVELKKKLGKWRLLLEDLQSDSDRGTPGMDDDSGRSMRDLWRRFEDLEEMARNLESVEDDDKEEEEELLERVKEEVEALESTIEEARESIDDV